MSSTFSNVTLLGPEVEGYNPSPSDRYYYNKYFYKITFWIDPDTSKTTHEHETRWRDLWLQLGDFFHNSPHNASVRYNSRSVFFIDYTLFTETLFMFSEYVRGCAGPISQEHIDMLLDMHYKIETRKHKYYHKYDCKIYAFVSMRDKGYQRYSVYRSEFDNLRKEIKQQLEPTVRIGGFRWGFDFYTNYADFKTIEPFIKLQRPYVKFRVTRCIVFDK